MKTSQMNPSRLVLALLAAGAIGGAGATAAFGGISMAASAPSAVASAAATPTAPVPSAPTPGAPNFVQITHDYGPCLLYTSKKNGLHAQPTVLHSAQPPPYCT